jgi:hypothetical protein
MNDDAQPTRWHRRTAGRLTDAFAAGERYFTDGVHLYRFVGWIRRSRSAVLAEVEDCYSLTVVLATLEDLRRLPLRPVVAAGA